MDCNKPWIRSGCRIVQLEDVQFPSFWCCIFVTHTNTERTFHCEPRRKTEDGGQGAEPSADHRRVIEREEEQLPTASSATRCSRGRGGGGEGKGAGHGDGIGGCT